jgi:hypothetical protein
MTGPTEGAPALRQAMVGASRAKIILHIHKTQTVAFPQNLRCCVHPCPLLIVG